MTSLNQFSESECVASKSFIFSAEESLHEVADPSSVYGCPSASRKMVLYSSQTATMEEQSYLPSLTDNNGAMNEQDAKMGAKKKGQRQKKRNDDRMYVSFPEVAQTIQVTKKASKAFARRSSSLKATYQTVDMSKNRQSATKESLVKKNRSGELRLPSLVLTPNSERVATEERWSNALGLRDSYEIPRKVFNKLTDDILKINQQITEESKMRQIREDRIIDAVKKSTERPSSFERLTSRPGFSYFPCLTRSVRELPRSNGPFWTEDKKRERMFREEQTIQRKMRQFKNRHSHFHLANSNKSV